MEEARLNNQQEALYNSSRHIKHSFSGDEQYESMATGKNVNLEDQFKKLRLQTLNSLSQQ
jgi:hypothetical protein